VAYQRYCRVAAVVFALYTVYPVVTNSPCANPRQDEGVERTVGALIRWVRLNGRRAVTGSDLGAYAGEWHMGADEHDRVALGVYVLGGLDEPERRSIEEHLAGCERCRLEQVDLEETRAALAAVPPEAFLHGPPDDGDLLLQRTLRQVRHESARREQRRRGLLAATAAVIVAVALAGGVLVGRAQERPAPLAQPAPSPPAAPAAPATPPAGTLVGSRTEPATGARITVRVVPAAGWVRVNAAVSGIPEGRRCRLWVVARDGARQLAGSWLVSANGAQDGTSLDGSALVPPAEVAAVEVDDVDGHLFVSVPL